MTRPELVVFSHLPWTFVWQRPQHLISRIAAGHRRTWFVEEPRVVAGRAGTQLHTQAAGPVTRVWLEVGGEERLAGFDDPCATGYPEMVAELLGRRGERVVWAYTPMALPYIDELDRELLVYDVMDDLASFAFASAALRANQDRLLELADVVFTGGRSIHAGVAPRTRAGAHLFPSGGEPEHYAQARRHRDASRERPVAGYVGVIDERIDLAIVRGLAERLPGWDVEMVGPVFKITPDTLPQAPNLRYPGMQPYERLPEIMAGFDVALMPFARNDATRSISPTKTLEYLAAGLPVVSTPIPDVVADYRGVVDLREDAEGFAAACEHVHRHQLTERDAKVRPLLRLHHWDTIAARMQDLMDHAMGTIDTAPRAAGHRDLRSTSWHPHAS
jgi:glycosyltransferase involved in cell wall biosynthesis